MPAHEDRLSSYNELTETLMSHLEPRVLQDISRDMDHGHHLHSLIESLYVYTKLKRFLFMRPLPTQPY
jgi:hypothetical protein